MIALKTSFPGTNELAVARFERQLGVRLPEDYRRFLLCCNGGEPMNGAFEVEGWGSTHVHVFYGLETGYDAYNLDWSRSRLEEVFPDSVIPIACDPGGYKVCLGVRRRAQGKVYFWDRGEQLDALVRIAESFDGFLSGLKPGT